MPQEKSERRRRPPREANWRSAVHAPHVLPTAVSQTRFPDEFEVRLVEWLETTVLPFIRRAALWRWVGGSTP
jgi:hypothetical protein